ncbi:MAG: AMP-dependent synthetase, partial [Acidimicrobiales bacterium]
MRVPLTISDFLDRAALVFPDRIGVVDEPGAPGDLGRLTYREIAARAKGMALTLDELGVPVGGRVGIVS